MYLSSSISKLLSLSLSCLHRASLLSISRCSFLCRRMFSSRICRSSSMYCARFSVSDKRRGGGSCFLKIYNMTSSMKEKKKKHKTRGQLPLACSRIGSENNYFACPFSLKFRLSYSPQCLNICSFSCVPSWGHSRYE